MLDRIGQIDLNGSSSINIIGFSKALKKEWHNYYELLTWEYGKHHLKKLDMDVLHCCMFELGGNCKHSHKNNSHIKCLTCFSFSERKVLPFLKIFNEEVCSNNKDEVATMMASVPKLSYAVSHYAPHCLFANVQFSAIEKLCSQ